MWSAAEVGAAVVSACLPVLRPIYTLLVRRRSSPGHTKIPSHTTPSNSGRSIIGLFTFWRTSSSSNRSHDTSQRPPVISTLNTSNGIDGDRWAAKPMSGISSIYKKNRSRESTATAITDLEMTPRNSTYTGLPETQVTTEQSSRSNVP